MPEAVMQPSVTAVVVTYQSGDTLGPALAALKCGHDLGLLNVVIVDNGSTDATQGILEGVSDWAQILLTGRNNGFGRACNIGAALATTPYTLFVNPDAVVEPEAIRAMLAFIEQQARAGIVGPAIIEGHSVDEPELQMTGQLPKPGTVLAAVLPLNRHPSGLRPIQPGSNPFRTGWVCGAVLMIRTDLLRRLGGFDPRFFLYWEEMDLCRRAEDAGFEIWAVGAAVTRHVGGASSSPDDTRISGCIARHYYQSRYYYLSKHHGRWRATLTELCEFALLVVRTLLDLLCGRGLRRLRPRLKAPLLSLPDAP